MAGIQDLVGLLSGTPMANQAAPLQTAGMGGAPNPLDILKILAFAKSPAVDHPPAMMGGMDGGPRLGVDAVNTAGKSDKMGAPVPRITNNTAANEAPIEADAEVVSPAGPRIGDTINNAAGDIFAGVTPNKASGFASFAGGFSGSRQNAAARADKARKDEWATEDRGIAAEDRQYRRKRDAIGDSRSAAAAGRAARNAELNGRLTEARIAALNTKGAIKGLSTKDILGIETAVDNYGKRLGLSGTSYVPPAQRAEAEAKVKAYRADLTQRARAAAGVYDAEIDGSAAADGEEDTGTVPTATAAPAPTASATDYRAAARAGQVVTTPTGNWKWNGSAWVKA